MGSPILHLFGGLAQGLGGSAMQLEQEARAKETEKRQQSLAILHGAFQQAAERGDNEKAATTLEMMKPLLGGKDGKPHYLDPMIGAIRSAQPLTTKSPTPEAEQSQSNINQIASQPPGQAPYAPGIGQVGPTPQQAQLESATRPRTAIGDKVLQKGYFATPEETAQRQLGMKVAEQQGLLPGELKKFEGEKSIVGKIYRENLGTKFELQGNLEEQKAQLKAQINNKYTQNLIAITGGNPENATPQQIAQAQQQAQDYYKAETTKLQANAAMNEARAKEYDTKHSDRVAKMAQDQKRIDAQVGNYASLADYRNWLQEHGNQMAGLKGSEIAARYGAGKNAATRLKDIQQKRGQLIPQLKQAQAIAANPLSDPETRAKAQGQIEVLENQYSEFEKQANDELQKLDSFSPSTSSPSLGTKTGAPNKTLNKPDSQDKNPLKLKL